MSTKLFWPTDDQGRCAIHHRHHQPGRGCPTWKAMSDDDRIAWTLRDKGATEDAINNALDLHRMASEKLLPQLRGWVEEDDTIGPMLKHPLVYSVPLGLPGLANRQYNQKRKALEQAIADEKWSTVVWLHERPYRLEALIDYVVGTDEEWAPVPLVQCDPTIRALAADVWVDSENIEQHLDDWAALFSGWNCGDAMLFNDDPDDWAQLPDPLVVYRAGIDDGGWSWTLDPKVAGFFARRFGATHVMTTGVVPKRCVFGYLTRRNESEVLIPDGTVTSVRTYEGGEE